MPIVISLSLSFSFIIVSILFFTFFFFMEIFFFIEKLKTWVHQIKPISWGKKKSKPTIGKKKKKVNTVWAIAELREYIL